MALMEQIETARKQGYDDKRIYNFLKEKAVKKGWQGTDTEFTDFMNKKGVKFDFNVIQPSPVSSTIAEDTTGIIPRVPKVKQFSEDPIANDIINSQPFKIQEDILTNAGLTDKTVMPSLQWTAPKPPAITEPAPSKISAAVNTVKEYGKSIFDVKRGIADLGHALKVGGTFGNAVLGTLNPLLTPERKKLLWEQVPKVDEQNPEAIEGISNTVAMAGLVYGGVQGLKALPEVANWLKYEGDLLKRRVMIKERALTTLTDKELLNIYKELPQNVKPAMARNNERLQKILKQENIISETKPVIAPEAKPAIVAPVKTEPIKPIEPAKEVVPSVAKEKGIFKLETGLDYDNLFGEMGNKPYEGAGDYKTIKEYYAKRKGLVGEVVEMSPDEYLSKIPYLQTSEKSIENLRKTVASGEKLRMPSLDYSGEGRVSQEGRHRALIAKEMGIEKIPVLVVNKTTVKGVETAPKLPPEAPKQAIPPVSAEKPSVVPEKQGITEELINMGVEIKNNKVKLYRGGNVSPAKLRQLRYGDFLSTVKEGKDIVGNAGASEYGKTIIEIELPVKDIQITNGEIQYKGISKSLEGGNKYTQEIYKAANNVWGSNYTAKEIDKMSFNEVFENARMGLKGGKKEFINLMKSEGKKVPAEVLKNYPELKKQVKPTPIAKPKEEITKPTVDMGQLNADTIIKKVTQALKESKPLRSQQEQIYSQERGKKLAEAINIRKNMRGEKGYFAELSALKGKLTKVEFETLRNKIGQREIDVLFNLVKDSPLLNEWDKFTAQKALSKIFGELGGTVPTENELYLLNRVFPKEFVNALLDKRDMFSKFKEYGYQLANIPRSVMASFDLSAPFRQGIFFATRIKQFFPAFSDMFKAFGSEKAFNEIHQEIIRRPTYQLMQENRLALTGMDDFLTQREEKFMSGWAEKIPFFGKGIRASGRAYNGFLNKLRADVFDDLIRHAKLEGLDPEKNTILSKQIANFVNTGTGRGSLGELQQAAVALNSFFFSPRLMASRLTLLNPIYYVRQTPFVRKQALKSLFGFLGLGLTVLGLAKLGGADIQTDPRNSDFGKLKIGNTRIDIWGGFQQYVRMFSQLISGKYISSYTGKEITLGEGYKPLTRYDILFRQIESKEAPLFSFITSVLKQQNFKGEQINIPKEIGNRFVPMVVGDAVDLLKDDPKLAPLAIMGSFGFGLQTYEKQTNNKPAFGTIKPLQPLKKPKLKKPFGIK